MRVPSLFVPDIELTDSEYSDPREMARLILVLASLDLNLRRVATSERDIPARLLHEPAILLFLLSITPVCVGR